jgi:hypothetical protein
MMMLELICNATWLAIGVTLTLRLVRQPQTRSAVAVRVMAVFCLLLVLFPVISLSDDLSAPEAALCDMSHSGDQSPGSTAVDHTGSVAVALAHSAAAIRLQFLHFAEPAQHRRNVAELHLLASDALRAPPAVL